MACPDSLACCSKRLGVGQTVSVRAASSWQERHPRTVSSAEAGARLEQQAVQSGRRKDRDLSAPSRQCGRSPPAKAQASRASRQTQATPVRRPNQQPSACASCPKAAIRLVPWHLFLAHWASGDMLQTTATPSANDRSIQAPASARTNASGTSNRPDKIQTQR